MKNSKWELILNKDSGPIGIETFTTKELAEEERDNRNKLCIAMGYTPDVRYIIRKA